MAHYQTIVLAMIEHRPELYEQLRASRMLLAAVNDLATSLRAAHLQLLEDLQQANPHFDPAQLRAEALEMAIQSLLEDLPSASTASEEGEGLSLDDAMSYLRRHTPVA